MDSIFGQIWTNTNGTFWLYGMCLNMANHIFFCFDAKKIFLDWCALLLNDGHCGVILREEWDLKQKTWCKFQIFEVGPRGLPILCQSNLNKSGWWSAVCTVATHLKVNLQSIVFDRWRKTLIVFFFKNFSHPIHPSILRLLKDDRQRQCLIFLPDIAIGLWERRNSLIKYLVVNTLPQNLFRAGHAWSITWW